MKKPLTDSQINEIKKIVEQIQQFKFHYAQAGPIDWAALDNDLIAVINRHFAALEKTPHDQEPDQEPTVNLRALGWSSCGADAWEYISSEDNGADGWEVFRNPKTGKYYEVQWDRVRHVETAQELPNEEECQECGAENDDINTCNNCAVTLCLDCDENEMPCGADGHTYCTPCVSKLFKEEDYEED